MSEDLKVLFSPVLIIELSDNQPPMESTPPHKKLLTPVSVLSMEHAGVSHCHRVSGPVRDGLSPELNKVFRILSVIQEPLEQRQGKQTRFAWILRASVCAPQMFRKMFLREARCRAFPKHWETWAFNIEESSGTVYPSAARHGFWISSDNFTWHFVMWYFRKQGNRNLQWSRCSLFIVFYQKKGSVFLCDACGPTDSFLRRSIKSK